MSRKSLILLLVVLFGLQVTFAGPGDLGKIKKQLAESLNVVASSKKSQEEKEAEYPKIAQAVKDLGGVGTLKAVKIIFECFPRADSIMVYEAVKEALEPHLKTPDIRAFLLKQMVKNQTWEVRALLLELYKLDAGDDVFDSIVKLLRDKRSEKIRRLL